MEVVVPVKDFHFDSAASSPYVSAPSSPKRFGRGGSSDPFDYYCHYTSAPTSPSRVAAILASSSAVPFDWEEKPGTPKSPRSDDVDDFAFDFSGQLEKGVPLPDLTTADELFEEGKIRPLKLKPPPRLYNLSTVDKSNKDSAGSSSPRSPKSPNRGLWAPRGRGKVVSSSEGKGFDPFAAAMTEATRGRERETGSSSKSSVQPSSSISSSRSRKGSRSLSPMRSGSGVGGGFFSKSSSTTTTSHSNSSTSATTIASECLKTTTSGGSRKWRLRDLLLFRSASEGRATGNKSKDPLRKYTMMPSSSKSSSPSFSFSSRKGGDDSRNSSFRSIDSGGSGSSIRRSAGSGASAHEVHYVSNRAASEEMKKKTALPFNRQGLFGCLRFNPAVHSVARGFHNSYSFGRRQ